MTTHRKWKMWAVIRSDGHMWIQRKKYGDNRAFRVEVREITPRRRQKKGQK